ncbi:DUF3221 domain-containing protein [Bacillus sp. FJAT-27445]|uniref:DUF3221 domain-containing protein n=1 Tax=Bacillus sp. FJAT-27445 TaxID=1679166 RepID=UPI000743A834|nr:DUF3221 domain-containing protein [Bacillus sp. FJAT-27445]
MRKWLLAVFISCFLLVGCNGDGEAVKGEFDVKGVISEISVRENRMLIEDNRIGPIWVTLPENGNIKRYGEGQEVVVWIDGGIDTSLPAQAKALNIEITKR